MNGCLPYVFQICLCLAAIKTSLDKKRDGLEGTADRRIWDFDDIPTYLGMCHGRPVSECSMSSIRWHVQI